MIAITKNGTYQNLSKELEKTQKTEQKKKEEQIVVPPKSIEVSQEDYEIL
jgi:hypothetical protein